MKKNSGSSQKLGSFLSPGAPSYRERSVESQKGWSSERILLQAATSNYSSRRQSSVASCGLTPFNSGRTIPSKWDDAERWISSPVNNQHQPLRPRPKSKSGPIVPPPGTSYYSNYSPAIPLRQGLVVKNLMIGSPFSTGVLAPDAVSFHHYYAAHDTVFSPRYDDDDDDSDNGMLYSTSPVVNQNGVALPSVSSAPMWSDSELLCEPSSPNFQDEKCDGTKNAETEIAPFLRRDKGTQMSLPETENDSAHSSPKSSHTLAMNPKNCNSSKLEVRDVEVDNQASLNKWSKPSQLHGEDLKKSSSKEAQVSSLDIAESTLDIPKFQREEAKIVAWESLQKAKAEAAIRKLEMQLEKKRSSSMDKILNKLRRAQMKAEKMRSITPAQQGHRVRKTWKVFPFPIWSPSRCFSGHAL